MFRQLVSYSDLAGRHGPKLALKVLRQMEQIARIEPEIVVSLDFDARFDRALKAIQNSRHCGYYA